MTMTFDELLKIRRSVRDYNDQPVPLALIETLIAETTCAPNASNEQLWRFSVVRDKEYMRRISDESKKNILSTIQVDPNSPIARYEAALRNPSFNVFYNAPCLVIISGPKERPMTPVDCSLAAAYFMLAAAARGLGTCWINLGSYIEDEVMRADLGLDRQTQIVAPIIVGYPKQVPDMPKRNPPRVLAVVG
jgi:nitroreductase